MAQVGVAVGVWAAFVGNEARFWLRDKCGRRPVGRYLAVGGLSVSSEDFSL